MDARDKLQTQLAGSYFIERELGGGGMSRVFLATEQKLNRRVVVKVLPAELAAAVSASRFEREILVAAGLTQANIVPVLASGQVDGVAHLETLRRPGMRTGQFLYSPAGFAIAARRLGELYEVRDELAKAIENYQAFVALWRTADPELQPQVADVNARIVRLRAQEARRR